MQPVYLFPIFSFPFPRDFKFESAFGETGEKQLRQYRVVNLV